ncbi:MAG TPA: hypothetical protein VL551_34945 [Actinospica sp.]|jgi:hypothetical protein|nr:hypothetical protein [Actinospica sp.]
MYAAPDINWDEEFRTEPLTGIHWHGFFWKGPAARKFSMRYQVERTPGTSEFETGDTPAEAVSDNLLRPRLVRATFTSADDAADWMRAQYDENRPASDYRNPDDTQWYMRKSIERGGDPVWRWDTPHPGDVTCNWAAVVCCPNRLEPSYPCPRPPQ